jgi:hypothetical protein
MATIRVCDHCGTQASVGEGSMADMHPKEWYNLRTLDFKGQVQLCSLDCVIAHAEGIRLGQQQEAAKELAPCENSTSLNIG